MKNAILRHCVLFVALVALLLSALPQLAQPVAAAETPAKTFSQQDLDRLLAPIALYPDALLAQILMASTYPLEVVEAARWAKANPKVTGKALESAMQKQPWDPSVRSLTAVPQVLKQMDENLAWTQKLGDAFLSQQKEIMATVQVLRAKALAAGNLKSTAEQVVRIEQKGAETIYIIESTKTEVVYVPTYNPVVVYGTWWYPYPPYYVYPPTYVYPRGVAFATGIVVGAAIWGNCDWHGRSVNVNIVHYNSFNKTTINNTNWNHNVEHRRGVAYKDQGVAQRYNRGTNVQDAKARSDYRGRVDAPGTGATMSRDSQSGFSGTGSGAATRAASDRGAASRGTGSIRR